MEDKSRYKRLTRYSKRNGERAGNAPLESTVAVINDFLPEIKINVKESSLLGQ
jgi:hypothetical protein